MSSGAVTLQCPSCGGVFLTLQQSGVVEICPHCAVSASRDSYIQTNAEVGPHARTELPTKRETVTPVLPDVFFPHTAVESGQHGDGQPPAPEPVVSPGHGVVSETPPVSISTKDNEAQPAPPTDQKGNGSQNEVRPDPLGNTSARPIAKNPPLTLSSPPRRKRPLGWHTFLMLSFLVGGGIWLAMKKQDGVVVSPIETHPPAATVQKPVVPVPVAPPKTDAKIPEEIVLRARAEDVHMTNLAEALVKGMAAAKTTDERLQFIDQPENHRADVERFFAGNGGKMEIVRFEPSVGSIIVLPSVIEEKLFKMITKKCPDGAIVRTLLKDNKAVLHWPLFEQSHDYLFDHFQKEGGGPDTPSVWFTVVCRLTESFDLTGPTKNNWLCLEAQGSLAAGGTGHVYVAKDTPAGRLLVNKMEWGKVYLTDLLVGRMEIDGIKALVVLDCAGTQPVGRPVH